MKKVYYYCIACFIAGITIGIIGGYNTGHQEAMFDESHTAAYEAACLYSDILRSLMDQDSTVSSEVEETFEEYCQDFETWQFQYLTEEKFRNDYSWAY